MRMAWRALAAAMIVAVAAAGPRAGAAPAEEPMSLLFRTQHLSNLGSGETIDYAHRRSARAVGEAGPGFDRTIRLTAGEGAEETRPVVVVMDAGGQARQLEPFRGVPGNPLLMVFLESAVRAVNAATGGSPFYLRNRIKEAMRERMTAEATTVETGGRSVAAREISFRPFEGDPNAPALGAFEALEMRFVLAEDAPGMFVALSARTPEAEGQPYFAEEIRLD